MRPDDSSFLVSRTIYKRRGNALSIPVAVIRRNGTIMLRLTTLWALWYQSRTRMNAFAVQEVVSNKLSFPRPIRELPDRLLIGYATTCTENVAQAVRNGVNVVIWSFLEIRKAGTMDKESWTINWNSLDPACIRQLIHDLDNEGYSDTIHLVSFGGWNGPHIDTEICYEKWFDIWMQAATDVGFHGIDWDLEGHDDLQSSTNTFSLDCLDFMGCISRKAKEKGYIIGVAPPQSYLDTQNSKFSRAVNLVDNDRTWHGDFHYFGSNVYAYLLAKYGDYVDFISIQFYESYSRAAMSVYGPDQMNAASYFEIYAKDLESKNFSIFVEFENDPSSGLSNQWVPLPQSKLIFGFANGWALDTNDKALFVTSGDVEMAYQKLREDHLEPRGFMFWVIGEEGKNGVQYASSLSRILETRRSTTSVTNGIGEL